jgi:hypothetical protein
MSDSDERGIRLRCLLSGCEAINGQDEILTVSVRERLCMLGNGANWLRRLDSDEHLTL